MAKREDGERSKPSSTSGRRKKLRKRVSGRVAKPAKPTEAARADKAKAKPAKAKPTKGKKSARVAAAKPSPAKKASPARKSGRKLLLKKRRVAPASAAPAAEKKDDTASRRKTTARMSKVDLVGIDAARRATRRKEEEKKRKASERVKARIPLMRAKRAKPDDGSQSFGVQPRKRPTLRKRTSERAKPVEAPEAKSTATGPTGMAVPDFVLRRREQAEGAAEAQKQKAAADKAAADKAAADKAAADQAAADKAAADKAAADKAAADKAAADTAAADKAAADKAAADRAAADRAAAEKAAADRAAADRAAADKAAADKAAADKAAADEAAADEAAADKADADKAAADKAAADKAAADRAAAEEAAPAPARPIVVRPGDAAEELASARVGGKAANLASLTSAGFRVPTWFAVTTEAFERFAEAADLRPAIVAALTGADPKDRASVRDGSAAARAAITDAAIPDAVAAAIRAAYEETFASTADAPFVAVRSSMVGEDAAGASFAGQMDSFLFVRDADGVLDAVRRCWASAFSERAVGYRLLRGLDPTTVEAAVVIQEMVEGETSGVLFTVNPTTGADDEVIVSAVLGLGEGLVSGVLDADSVIAAKGSGAVRSRDTVEKARRVVFDRAAGSGTTEEDVPSAHRAAPAVDDSLARRLAELGRTIEVHYDGVPQDVEWTVRDGEVHLLQSRPVTAIATPAASRRAAAVEGDDEPRGKLRLWDNSNIIESYSGITTPLTFSFARNAYHQVYRQFLELLGVPYGVIDLDDRTLRNMLGLIRGRIYYNLNNWYKLVSYLPGFEYNREFMEQMMGVRESATLITTERAHETPRKKGRLARLGGFLSTAWVGVGLVQAFRRLDKDVAWFMDHFETVYDGHRHTDLDALDEDGLLDLYMDLENQLLRQWKAPIVNDFSAMIFFGVLRKLCVKWIGDEAGSLQNDLLCGEGGIESTEPTKRIFGLAALARRDPALAAIFRECPPSEIHAILDERREEFPAMWAEVQDYLDRYGDRCMMELKLESKNLRDDPSFVYAMVRNYLDGGGIDLGQMERREKEVRAAAEKRVKRALRGRPLRKRIFDYVVRRTRASVKNRENMRFARTKIFGVARRIFRAFGHRLHAKGMLEQPGDVFYLEVPELFGATDGTLSSDDLRGISLARKTRFQGYHREEAPADRFTTRGFVYQAANDFGALDAGAALEVDDPTRMTGTSACPGVVTERVRVISSPEDEMSLNGQILVAERTDPGWVPLFPSASGLLIERGSLLSHSAIVAREMGIPAIVGIKDVTRRLNDGQRVTMDARAGIVHLDVDQD